jgi:hypothetical protein
MYLLCVCAEFLDIMCLIETHVLLCMCAGLAKSETKVWWMVLAGIHKLHG